MLALWRKAKRDGGVTTDQVVAEIYRLRDKYGEFVVPNPQFPRMLEAGEPVWADPIKRRVVAAMGGWVNFCRDDSPGGVQRGQLLKIAASVLAGEGDEAVERLRLEYREARAALPLPRRTRQAHRSARLKKRRRAN